MPPAELQELGRDIKQRGQVIPVTIFKDNAGPAQLLDGISRLDAMEMAGIATIKNGELDRDVVHCREVCGVDPYAHVLSANLHRRHLTAEQKRDLVAKVLKGKPEQSNRSIARQTNTDHKTVAAVREEKIVTGEIPQLEKTVGGDGKSRAPRQPANSHAELRTPAGNARGKGSAKARTTPRDDALIAFNERVLDLVRRIGKHDPPRFAATAVPANKLAKLGRFFADLAGLKTSGAETNAVSADQPAGGEMAPKPPVLEPDGGAP
jgi:hypothetical protein